MYCAGGKSHFMSQYRLLKILFFSCQPSVSGTNLGWSTHSFMLSLCLCQDNLGSFKTLCPSNSNLNQGMNVDHRVMT